MMTTTTKANVRLAKCLAVLCADWLETKPSRTADMRKEKFNGACWSANALGYGMTPTEVFMTVMEWVRDNPRPTTASAMKVEYKAWAERVESEVATALGRIL